MTGSLFLFLSLLIFFFVGSDHQQPSSPASDRQEPLYTRKITLDFSPFEQALSTFDEQESAVLDKLLTDTTILQIQDYLHTGQITSRQLLLWYLSRIKQYDDNGINGILELNPAALETTDQLDRERKFGKSNSYMFGIPVLITDTIATSGGMHTTAGSFALKDWQPQRDAFLVSQLREAGAIILGKTNLSEWASQMDTAVPDGFSTLGGQTRNPAGNFDLPGAASGSAVAVSANFATVAVTMDTLGTASQAAAGNRIVCLKTSRGLVSRDNIIPLLDWLDTPVPMGKTVTDVAVLLTTLVGVDKNDQDTLNAGSMAGTDFTLYLNLAASQDLRIGLVGGNASSLKAASVFTDLGREVIRIDGTELPTGADFPSLLEFGFKDSLNRFLSAPERNLPVKSLAGIVAVNDKESENRAPYGQQLLLQSLHSSISSQKYQRNKKLVYTVYRQQLHKIFTDHDVDVLIIDSREYAAAGFPAITVPTGIDGQPAAVTLTADYLGETKLIAAGYAFEQQVITRRAPDLPAIINPASNKSTSGQTAE